MHATHAPRTRLSAARRMTDAEAAAQAQAAATAPCATAAKRRRGNHAKYGYLNQPQTEELERLHREFYCEMHREMERPLAGGDTVMMQLPLKSQTLPEHLLAKREAKGVIVREHASHPGRFLVEISWQQKGRGGATSTIRRPNVAAADLRE